VLDSSASHLSYVNDTTAKSLRVKVKSKGKVHPIIGDEDPERE
jgi:hypothetical protein